MISVFAHHGFTTIRAIGFTTGNAFDVRQPGTTVYTDAETVVKAFFITFIHEHSIF